MDCQTEHWQTGGHKEQCVSLVNNKQPRTRSSSKKSGGGDGGGEKCDICLAPLKASQAVPVDGGGSNNCAHRFHQACVDELRANGVADVCPHCRAELPPSAERVFADGYTLFMRNSGDGSSSSSSSSSNNNNNGFGQQRGQKEKEALNEVLKLWVQAADQGLPVAQYNLGVMYDIGKGVKKSAEKAAEWWLKAAELGHVSAQFNMGSMYAQGRGVPQDELLAAKFYELAAKQGDTEAQVNLGVLYDKRREDGRAFDWWLKAAERGDPEAQCE